jgi:RNA recognition motif-containing protein
LNYQEEITVDGRRLVLHPARPPRQRKRDTAFVGGVPEGTTIEEIKAAFAKYNPIDVRIIRTASTEAGRGFAFVQFDTEEHQSAAVRDNRTIPLHGGDSVVRFARPQARGSFRGGPRRFNGPPRGGRAPRAAGPRRAGPRRSPRGPPREGSAPPAETKA